MKEEKRNVGNGIGIGAALRVAFGAAYGYKSGNISHSIALGLAIGVAIGAIFDFVIKKIAAKLNNNEPLTANIILTLKKSIMKQLLIAIMKGKWTGMHTDHQFGVERTP